MKFLEKCMWHLLNGHKPEEKETIEFDNYTLKVIPKQIKQTRCK